MRDRGPRAPASRLGSSRWERQNEMGGALIDASQRCGRVVREAYLIRFVH
jgi:hypothetical protein